MATLRSTSRPCWRGSRTTSFAEPMPEGSDERSVANQSAAQKSAPKEEGDSSWRGWLPCVLILLPGPIALVSALNVWVKRQALDTNNWTNSSAQLLENEKVRGALSVYLVDQLYQNVNVGKELQAQLPAQVKGVAAPLAGALREVLVRA